MPYCQTPSRGHPKLEIHQTHYENLVNIIFKKQVDLYPASSIHFHLKSLTQSSYCLGAIVVGYVRMITVGFYTFQILPISKETTETQKSLFRGKKSFENRFSKGHFLAKFCFS